MIDIYYMQTGLSSSISLSRDLIPHVWSRMASCTRRHDFWNFHQGKCESDIRSFATTSFFVGFNLWLNHSWYRDVDSISIVRCHFGFNRLLYSDSCQKQYNCRYYWIWIWIQEIWHIVWKSFVNWNDWRNIFMYNNYWLYNIKNSH